MGLHDAEHHVTLFSLHLGTRHLEHGVRLSDAGRRAEEDGELASLLPRLGGYHAAQQLVGIRTVGHLPSESTLLERVEGQVQLQDVDARLADDSQETSARMSRD